MCRENVGSAAPVNSGFTWHPHFSGKRVAKRSPLLVVGATHSASESLLATDVTRHHLMIVEKGV
jgi:hypothetical protein